MKLFLSFLLIALLISAPSFARKGADDSAEHHSSGHHESEGYDDSGHHSGAVDVYAPAMEKMHADMMIEPSGNADVDFVRGMIPHHHGAIDMAKILKEKGKDPALQKMADDIISAQEREIAFMKDWLKKNGN